MGWDYPDISLESLTELIKGFVDMLILTSGYQSSGRNAFWDSHNIKKAFEWALFFENVIGCLKKSDFYEESVKELDVALSAMSSDASFPQGFTHISSAVLSNSQNFLLEHLIHTIPLRDDHLRALLIAIIEMDLDELSHAEHGSLVECLKKLKLENASKCQVFDKVQWEKNSGIPCLGMDEESSGKRATEYFSQNVIESLLKRQSAVSRISTIEKGLQVLSTSIKNSIRIESDNTSLQELKDGEKCHMRSLEHLGFLTCNRWKLRNLMYVLDKRTIRIVSGASMIFSAPKIQWERVLSGLNVLGKNSEDNLIETIELLLIGAIGSRWSSIINAFMSVSYFALPTSEMCYELWSHPERPESFHSEKKASSKEIDILNFLMVLLDGRLDSLFKLSPGLAAAAIPSWSPAFRLYLSELQTQLNSDCFSRSCDFSKERKEHTDCELAERIWCLYVCHKFPGANFAGNLRIHR